MWMSELAVIVGLMLAHTFTATFVGLQPIQVEVEVDGNRGVPALIFIGLPSKATAEAHERITSALQNCGFRIRSKRTIVNLAPADIPKHGSSFDVAIALGILKMYGELQANTDQSLFLGELSLEGRVKSIRGCLPLVLAAQKWGFKQVFVPQDNLAEVALIDDLAIYPVERLQELLAHLSGQEQLPRLQPQRYESLLADTPPPAFSFDDIIGQEEAKQGLLVAAAGGHNVLMSGPPGMGKTILAESLVSLLPPLSKTEAIEVTNLYSVSGLNAGQLLTSPPFRHPHHTITAAALVGGGNPIQPGEISLAHHGLLFLDELLEFPSYLLETLRQPLESKKVVVCRANGRVEFPANFMLVAAMNPCPCGYRGASKKVCTCPEYIIHKYEQKLSGPLLDRFDVCLQVQDVEKPPLSTPTLANQINQQYQNKTSESPKEIITAVIDRQKKRFIDCEIKKNGEMNSKQVRQYCHLSSAAQVLLDQSFEKMQLSIRSYFKIIKIAQTIADLASSDQIEWKHMSEALQYRYQPNR